MKMNKTKSLCIVLLLILSALVSPFPYVYGENRLENDSLLEGEDKLKDLNELNSEWDGNGTEEYPYLIYNVHDLQDMNEYLSAHYVLANDIDANETEDWNDGAGFEPVGNDTVEFTGSLDGRNHTITGLYINNSENNYVGLFGVVGEEAVIKNTGLVNTNITADRNVGGLVGENYGMVENSYATGNTTGKGDYYVGGLIARNIGTVENSYATGNTTGKEAGEDGSVGGLIGRNRHLSPTGGTVKNSYATGYTTGQDDVGGLVGNNRMATIEDSYAAGKVSGDDYVGGLVGQTSSDLTYSSHIYNSTTSADVRGDERVGGLVGRNREYCTIYNSSATGDVLGTSEDVGGLVGQNDGSVSNSHAHGDVSSNRYVGGLVGQNSGPFDDMVGSIENSSATGNVSGESHVGGLVGRNGDIDSFEEGVPGFIENSYATGTSEGNESIGGLVGFNVNGTVSRSYATGNVDGEEYVGGLIGINNGTVSDSYAAGNTTGETSVGGLVGYNWDGTVENTYAVGNVSGTSEVGGLVGDNLGTVSNSFYDLNTTGQDDTGKGEPKTTEEMMTENTFTEAGWNFDEIWYIHDGAGYPIHLWDLRLSYVITDVEELNMIRFDLAGNYTIANDIDASETMDWNDGAGFEPLGTWDEGFTGTLDGNGHTITGLYINRSETIDVGLFGFIEEGAVVKNVGLVNSNVTGQWAVGGLVGTNSGTVDDSYVKGTTFGQEGVGGLVGYNWEGTVKNSYALGNTAGIGESWGIGGLVGINEHGSVKDSHAMGNTTGVVAIGGLVGVNELGLGLSLIENSYAIGNTSGVENVGGLVGENIDTIESSSAFGYTTGEEWVGGLVGYNWVDGVISDSYSEGNTTEGEIMGIGGLVGGNQGTVKNSYVTGEVIGGDLTGGLVGDNWGGTVENSYATGKITGTWGVGGLIGYNMAGNGLDSHPSEDVELYEPLEGSIESVSTSYATGDITGSNFVGGLVGYNEEGTIENCYSMGSITRKTDSEETDLGAFVGFNHQGKIINCYSTGRVIYENEDNPTDKGFAGNVTEGGNYEMSSNFWDYQTSEQDSTAGNATGKSTQEMQNFETFTEIDTEGLDEPWDIEVIAAPDLDDDYPYLGWEAGNSPVWYIEQNVYAVSFDIFVDNITAGDKLVIDIFDAVDQFGDPLDASYSVTIDIGGEIEYVTLSFANGEGSYTWEQIVEADEYTSEVTIDQGTASDTFTVNPGEVDTVTISPIDDQTTVSAGEDLSFNAEARDEHGNLITSNLMEFDWDNATDGVFNQEFVGDYDVTATYDEVTSDPVTIIVAPGDSDYIKIAPKESTIFTGDKETYTAFAYDEFHNEIGDVTSDTNWSIAEGAGGSWDGNVYTSENAGEWTVNGAYGELVENATLVVEISEYTLALDIKGEGNVEIDPDQKEYEHGTEVTLTALADKGWTFSHWEGDYPESEEKEDTIEITMDDEKEITAVFEKEEVVETYELIVNIDGEGTVDIDLDQDEYENDTEVILTANPGEGWFFHEWTGDYTGTEEEITITMNENKSITANFEELLAEFEVTNFNVEVDGLKVTIMAKVENIGNAEGSFNLMIDGEIVETITLGVGGTHEYEYTHEFDEEGDYEINFSDEEDIYELETVNVEDDGLDMMMIAGIILIIVIILAIIGYMMMGGEGTEQMMEEEQEETGQEEHGERELDEGEIEDTEENLLEDEEE